MDTTLHLEGHQALPLPFDDQAAGHLTLRHCLAAIPSTEKLLLLLEARRLLLPGGTLHLVLAATEDEVRTLRLAGRLGWQRATGGQGAARDERGERLLVLRKPERRPAGMPPVSVAIPAYSPRFFEQSLASAIAQTYPNLEIVVCDDSGGTEIEATTRRLGTARNVAYFRNAARLRGRGNYAKCFDVAGGEFIKYLNDDDILAPDCVARLVDAFRLAPDIALATSYRRRIDERGDFLPDQAATRPLVDRDVTIDGTTLANVMLMTGVNVVGEPTTTLFRKADLQRAIPDDFRFDSTDCMGVIDVAMWTPLLLAGHAVYLRDALSHFRIHAGQQQNDPGLRQPAIRAMRSLQSKWLKLGLHARLPPGMLRVKPFPDRREPWQPHPFTALRPVPAAVAPQA